MITYSTEAKEIILSLTVFDYVSLLSSFNQPPLCQTSPHTCFSATTSRCGQLFPCFSPSFSCEVSFSASRNVTAPYFIFIPFSPNFGAGILLLLPSLRVKKRLRLLWVYCSAWTCLGCVTVEQTLQLEGQTVFV